MVSISPGLKSLRYRIQLVCIAESAIGTVQARQVKSCHGATANPLGGSLERRSKKRRRGGSVPGGPLALTNRFTSTVVGACMKSRYTVRYSRARSRSGTRETIAAANSDSSSLALLGLLFHLASV